MSTKWALWQALAQNKPVMDISDRSLNQLLEDPFCCSLLQIQQPPTQHSAWAERASWRPFCQLMFGSKSWANRDILKGNCIFSLQFSGHKFRWWAHLLVSKIHSFPPNDEWHKHSEPQGLGPGAAATHLTMESEVAQSCPALCNPIDCSLP